jgi:nucleotide-binding universal stress UspA family protein
MRSLPKQENNEGEMFRYILYATDGSFGAERAGDYAASLAVRFHAKVIVLHAFNQLTVPPAGYNFPNADAYANPEDAEALVKKAAERLHNHGVKEVEFEVIQGQAVHVILGVAETSKPDVIVMGARGVSTWQGLLLGSTSMSVVQRAQIPVLVVK